MLSQLAQSLYVLLVCYHQQQQNSEVYRAGIRQEKVFFSAAEYESVKGISVSLGEN